MCEQKETTNFQKNCVLKCKKFFQEENISFEKIIGGSETYYKAFLKVKKHTIELYVYDDEAGFMIDGQDWTIYEQPDYPSGDQLVSTFITGLSKTISKFKE